MTDVISSISDEIHHRRPVELFASSLAAGLRETHRTVHFAFHLAAHVGQFILRQRPIELTLSISDLACTVLVADIVALAYIVELAYIVVLAYYYYYYYYYYYLLFVHTGTQTDNQSTIK